MALGPDVAQFRRFAEAEHFLHRTIEPDHPPRLSLSASSQPLALAQNATAGGTSGVVAVSLQLSQTASSPEVRKDRENSGHASRSDQQTPDVPKYLHIRSEFVVVDKN